MLTILEQSGKGKVRNFRKLHWDSANHKPETLTKTFWEVRTNYRKHKFIQYLQMKHLNGECNLTEYRCLLDAPGVLRDNLYIDALRAWMTDVPRRILWQRLATLQRLLQLPEWSLNLYYTYNGSVNYEIVEARQPIRKVKKFSGYVRNSSSVGSKRRSSSSRPDPESFEWNTNVEIDYYLFLTVGEFNSGLPGMLTVTPMMAQRKSRNGHPLSETE